MSVQDLVGILPLAPAVGLAISLPDLIRTLAAVVESRYVEHGLFFVAAASFHYFLLTWLRDTFLVLVALTVVWLFWKVYVSAFVEARRPTFNTGCRGGKLRLAREWRHGPRVEPYDLTHEPGELHNLADISPRRTEMVRALFARLGGLISWVRPLAPAPPDRLQCLKPLGYAQ